VLYWNMRELLATVAALWDVNISHPIPVLGDPEPIFP
jgi:vancomycin permeability regulator SanA